MQYVYLVCFLFFWGETLGQMRKPVQYATEVGSYFSTSGEIPFWLRANQYGIVPREQAIMTLRAQVRVDYHDAPKTTLDSLRAANRWADWGYCFNAVANAGYGYTLIVPEAYVKVKLGGIEIWGGRRREIVGLADSSLGTGSYIWSGNALPMLKLQVALPDYWPRRGLFAFKGFYAHGWFEENRFIKHTLLHQKALYGRFGKPNWRLKLYGGFNHQVQWGGSTEFLPGNLIRNNQLPNTFRDYIDIVTGKTLGNRTDVDTSRISQFDRENRIGNHLGTIDVGFEYTGRRMALFMYRQSIYDDGSLFYLTNIRDGLHGLRIRNLRPPNANGLQIQTILVEYLSTISQGGNQFVDNVEQKRGRDNYFNHSQYRDGWSRYGLTMGTPFITPTAENRADLPPYHFTNNNRVMVWHLGIGGRMLDYFQFQTKVSYSRNLGTYETPFPGMLRQFSGSFQVSIPVDLFGGVSATAAFATDFGDLFDRNAGYFFSLKKEFIGNRGR